MAYVGISNALIAEVSNRIKRQQNVEVNAIQSLPQTIDIPCPHDVVVKLIWGEQYHLKDVIPADWKHTVTRVSICSKDAYDRGCSVTLNIPGGMEVPPSMSQYSAEAKVDPEHELIKDYVALSSQRSEIVLRWNCIKDKVLEFLQSCKSLNEAVKLWPDVRYYIPQEYLTRLDAKAERAAVPESKAQEILKTIDTDAAVAAIVAARMVASHG